MPKKLKFRDDPAAIERLSKAQDAIDKYHEKQSTCIRNDRLTAFIMVSLINCVILRGSKTVASAGSYCEECLSKGGESENLWEWTSRRKFGVHLVIVLLVFKSELFHKLRFKNTYLFLVGIYQLVIGYWYGD